MIRGLGSALRAGILCSVFLFLGTEPLAAGTAGTATYTYDPLGRLIKITFPDGTQSNYSYDAAGNRTSIDLGATVPPPSAPTGLTASSPNNTVSLSWTASTDTGGPGISGYRVLRCTGSTSLCGTFALVGTPSTTTYLDTTVAASTTYTYAVVAVDTSNNESSPSAAAEVTTGVPGTFQLVSTTRPARGRTGEVAAVNLKNSGGGSITGIAYSCAPSGYWHLTGTSPTSLNAGASGNFACQATIANTGNVTFTFTGSGATNSPFSPAPF